MEEEKKYILDRFEEDWAVLERGDTQIMEKVKKNSLPVGAVEGDLLIYKAGAFQIDQAATQKRRAEIRRLMDQLWE